MTSRSSRVTPLHGWWASRIGGSSANALSSEVLADLGGGSTLHDTWVEVQKITQHAGWRGTLFCSGMLPPSS